MKLGKLTLASITITSGLLLSACGGGGDGPGAQVSTTPTVATIDAASGAATVATVAAKPFSFATGVAALGTTSATTLTFQAASAGSTTPGFSIASAEGSASGGTRFGSCIFTVTTSTFPASHPLATGKTVTINPCAISIDTVGAAADGASANRGASLVLGTTSSSPTPVVVAISPNGEVAIGGTVVGKTPLKPTTGAGS